MIAANEQTVGPKMVARTVPGFCRLAIEAACVETIRRRWFARGTAHTEVQAAIESARTLHQLAAIAIFDDESRTGEVFSHLKNKHGPWAADAFRCVKEGAHGNYTGSVRDLITASRKIADTMRAIA
jgi:hypothetical protein